MNPAILPTAQSGSTQDLCTILIQQLHEGVTQELLFKEFKKYGEIKSLKYYPKTKSANIIFNSPEQANSAKRALNHSKLLAKEINIVNFHSKDELIQKKKFNLFIHNVPQDLETKKLADFLTKYGEIISLMLKKDEGNKNLGYGYVQFETKEAYEKILEEHKLHDKIQIPHSENSFNVQQFNDNSKNKTNSIYIHGFYEEEIPKDQVEKKMQEIRELLEQVKNEFKLLNFYPEYNEAKKNFWAKIDFSYTDEKQEDDIYMAIKELVKKHFSYKNNIIQINKLFGSEIPITDASKKEEVDQTLQAIKEQLKLVSVSSQFNKIKKNFRVKIEFAFDNNKKDETVAAIEKLVKEKFPQSSEYVLKPVRGPAIHFKTNESSERNLFLKGVQTTIKEQDIADWIEECINVEVDPQNIKITQTTLNANMTDSAYNASVFFEEKEHGQKLMIFSAKVQNKDKNDMILQPRHKVTLFLKKADQEIIKGLIHKTVQFTNNSNIKLNVDVEQPKFHPTFLPFFPNQFVGKFPQTHPFMANQHAGIPNNIGKVNNTNKPNIPSNNKPATQPATQNAFIKFYQLNQEEKRTQIDGIVQAIQTNSADFDSLKEDMQRSILGQIIYYKISNLDVEKDGKLQDYLKDVSEVASKEQAKAKVEEFKRQVAKITGMLIDSEIFTIPDIIEIVKDEKELIERCNEAIELIQSQQN